ncbi:SRPBCC family protein [Mycobacterium sp. CBMA293]|uniref:SRPBCC family protein n=1 Tax=unclassified Mycolicibacterium TaxID=2636767 RepID=UPI0012DECD45|nr:MULTISPECIES: SRPBCC family protein [unclassified Mycolicibacterium]MUL47232.1 SRPBCC family protein [Mycolicibacterium sp. CBMA 360]MUL61342.1 SRPBCC family protein [Mycolicibacterium sp. CBMA 335]MUL72077.1 SRPBCC family protein [Mycolicibacterium sp. CBMA 311]MUL96244.1 SRPBCC family protein [Mycolicibacterium sp. CBMA 230]MUM08932.1 hypothetical protein [Mycolicibacterium sp. CBMA 213]
MPSASASVDLNQPPSAVWELIGGFGSLPDWSLGVSSSELTHGGRLRHLRVHDGALIVERLLAFDERNRTYTYTIVESPLPVTDYFSTLRVLPGPTDAESRVEWSGTFVPHIVSVDQATAVVQKIYDDGLASLVAHYAGGA